MPIRRVTTKAELKSLEASRKMRARLIEIEADKLQEITERLKARGYKAAPARLRSYKKSLEKSIRMLSGISFL